MIRSNLCTMTGMLVMLPVFQLSAALRQTAEIDKPVAAASQGTDDPKKSIGGDQKIRFQFQESDWKDVIPWFAEQAGYSLQPINDWPEGTFYLKDDSEYTVKDALDQLNHALRMRNPPFTLICNRNMLIMTQLENANFPNELIETVRPEDLDSRGKYEILSCIFDLGDLDVDTMFQELRPMVSETHQNYFAQFPAANQIHVREAGGTLRDIRNLIDTAKSRMSGESQSIKTYQLKNVDAETFMLIARGLLGMEPGRDFAEDGSLTISREPFGDRMYVRGTDKMLKLFDETAEVVDVPQDAQEGVEIAKLRFKTYSIQVDPKLAFDLLQTVLEGSPAKMQQDEVTGSITIQGRDEDHLAVDEALAAIAGEGGGTFAIIKLINGDATEIGLAVQNLLRQTATAETVSGPVVISDSILNQILVRGKPQEVREVTRMVKELDDNSLPLETGPRTGTRIINMDTSDLDALTPSLIEDLLGETGRKNSLNVVLPDQRKDLNSRIRGLPESPSSEQEAFEEFLKSQGVVPVPEKDAAPDKNQDSPPKDPRGSSIDRGRLFGAQGAVLLAQCFGVTSYFQTGLLVSPTAFLQQDDTTTGKTSDEIKQQNDADYRPVDAIPSVPGAPLEVRYTDYGVVLTSDDLDALDDMERAIRKRLGEESETQLPTFFFLQHRKAESMKPFIEEFFGLATSGGGGGGGAGGLMGGMMNNMLGGGAGDLLGGLLGGGGGLSSGSGDGLLEGDVRFGMDVSFNSIYVAGATGSDLDQISQLIELLDKPDPPHNPDPIGEFRTIEILHRDVEKVKEIIEKQIPDFLESENPEGGAPQNNEAAQMMKALAQLQGGKGGGAAAEEQKEPKARLGVDVTTSRLLITGPEFIYREILTIVADLDRPDLSEPLQLTQIDRQTNNQAVLDALKGLFGEDIEIIEPEEDGTNDESGSSSSGGGPSRSSTAASGEAVARAQQQQQQQMQQAREAFGRMMQQQQGGGGRGGADGGGGQGRGRQGGGGQGGGGQGGGGQGGGGQGGGGQGGGGQGDGRRGG